MYPEITLPKPLTPLHFYILLALSRGDSRRYQLKNYVRNDSLGSLSPDDAPVYRAVAQLHDAALIEFVREEPGRKYGTTAEVYGITAHGRIRLQEEVRRLEQAVKIARHAGIMDDATPTDIQRLRLELLDGGEG